MPSKVVSDVCVFAVEQVYKDRYFMPKYFTNHRTIDVEGSYEDLHGDVKEILLLQGGASGGEPGLG